MAAPDHIRVHGVGEYTPIDRLLHVAEFIEPALHRKSGGLRARQYGSGSSQEFEKRKIVQRPTDRHLDEFGFIAKMERLAELDSVAAPSAVGPVVGTH